MLVRVLCSDKSRGYIDDNNLQNLIERGVVIAYSRPEEDEWINVRENHSNMGKKHFRNYGDMIIKPERLFKNS